MQQDEQAIRQLIARWLSASQAGDTEKVLSLMADDVVFLMPGQAPMRGKAAYAAGQKALSQVDIEAHSEVQEIKVFGEWAYCWTQLAVAVTPRARGAPLAPRPQARDSPRARPSSMEDGEPVADRRR